MKSLLINIHSSLIMLIFAAMAFPAISDAQTNVASEAEIKIEVVYFHAPNRCPSCVATENQTKSTLEKYFRAEMEKGVITFASLDLKEKKNESLVEKYEIVFPTLLILKKQGNKEIKTDFSTSAFQYAYPEPKKYEKLLQAEILKQLNSNKLP